MIEQDQDITKVIFRKFPEGDIIALFPELPYTNAYDFMSYMHIGQHGRADDSTVSITTLATPFEYASLKMELESIGYNLKVYKRITPQMRRQRKENLREWWGK